MMLLTGEKYYYECKKNECARLHDASCSMLVTVQKKNLQSSKGGILTVYCLTVNFIQTVNYVMLKKHLVKSSTFFDISYSVAWRSSGVHNSSDWKFCKLRVVFKIQSFDKGWVVYPSDNATPLYCSLKNIKTSVGVKIILSTSHKNWLISEWEGYSI